MKKIILGILLILTLGATAQADWKCRADNAFFHYYGYGWNRPTAETYALQNCINNTPFTDVCVIRRCWWQ